MIHYAGCDDHLLDEKKISESLLLFNLWKLVRPNIQY